MEFLALAMPPLALGMVLARRRLWPNVTARFARSSLLAAAAPATVVAILAFASAGRNATSTLLRVTAFSAAAFIWVYLPAMWIGDELRKRA
ncbi:MAG TPA: hypothetical protein VNC78_01875 [Actinomycetota bacterium]|nr:hypothetical protein [Actinomycetota bacterium]